MFSEHAESTPFNNANNGFNAERVQTAIEEARIFNPPFKTVIFDDFVSGSLASAYGWATVTNSQGDVTLANGSGNSPGIRRMFVSSAILAADGQACQHLGLNGLLLGQSLVFYSWRVLFENLSAGGQTYVWRAGLGDTTLGDYTDGVYFEYNTGQSPNFLAKTSAGGTRSSVDTGVQVQAGAVYLLRASINENGTLAEFRISVNGGPLVIVAQINTNIPTVGQTGPNIQMLNLDGNDDKSMIYDYFELEQIFNTPRLL